MAGLGDVVPDWPVGIAWGVGGLVGGCLGARLQPCLPETVLCLLLGMLAAALGGFYALQALT
ncbi:hypothetical protein GCM10009601_63780 [Streptomyces thermospinosisporus]|uniref:GlsB/YeaQ/YmgE family stress response membrane protein n=1 Tax=Streptomyces thermospinosisporus TaxID=161482 RepID=A0ABP4JYR6_9ACTN